MPIPSLPINMIPLASGYSSGDPGGVLGTEVAGGFSRYALDWDRGPQKYAITLILSAAKFSIWNAFYFHIIKKGSLAFTMSIDSGFGLSPHTCQIIPGSYSTARLDGLATSVAFSVEAENQAYTMTAAEAQDLIDIYNLARDDVGSLLYALSKFANVDSNILNF